MNVYSIEMQIVATLYVKAEAPEEALEIARGCNMNTVNMASGEVGVSSEPLDSSSLPDVSFFPVATVWAMGIEPQEMTAEFAGKAFSEKPAWADDRQATEEGWGIFETNGRSPFELQRIEGRSPIFESDEAAWKFVADKAAAGALYHQKALYFIRDHSPAEFKQITADELVVAAIDVPGLGWKKP